MATKYYNDATGDHLWQTLGNWWDTSPGVGAAAALPATGDTVLLTGAVTQSSYSATVANLTITNFTLNMNLTVSGSATFVGTAKNAGVVTGTCVFQSTSENLAAANVLGGCTFSTSAKNYGTVTGVTVFDNASTNESGGVIQGACTLNSTSQNKAGAVISGDVVMNSSSVCAGTINGYTQMHSSSSVTSAGVVNGSLDMDGSSTFAGVMTGVGLTVDSATLSAGAVATCTAALIPGGTISGTLNTVTAAFSSSGTISATGIMNISGAGSFYNTNNSGVINGAGTILFTQYSYNYGTVNCAYAKFENFSENKATPTVGTVNCNVDFIDQCYNRSAIVAGHVLFNDSSVNTGTVTSNDCKIYAAGGNNTGTIVGVGNFYGDTGTGYYGDNVGGTVTGSTNSYWPATYPVGGSVSVSSNYYGYAFLRGQAQIGVRGIVDTLGIQDTVSLGNITGLIGLITRGNMNAPVTLSRGICKIGVKGTLRLTTADAGFTVKQALAAIFSVWGAGCSDGCDAAYTAKGSAALDILNGCMQEILLNSKELQYLSRETITLQLEVTADAQTGLFYVVLPDTVQAVVGPVRFYVDNNPGISIRHQLIGVSTKSQIMNFNTYYATNGGNTIYGYWIDRAYQATGDRSRIRIYVSGFFSDAEVAVDVEREALRYRAADCASGTVIPLPHQYAESLLLPLLREAASASPHASRRDSAPMYQSAAASARKMFRLADPQNPALEPKPERSRKP